MDHLTPNPPRGRGALLFGGLAAVLASTCCFGPLVLLAFGISGAWIGNLTRLEPFRPYFIAAAAVAMWFACRGIHRPSAACRPGEVCAIPHARTAYRMLFALVVLLFVVAIGFPFVAPMFY
jgi:mercuric ion transport protein